MFKCDVTGRDSKLGEKMNKVVTETREKVYTEKQYINGRLVEVEVGFGYETVKELTVSEEGMRILEEQ